MRKNVLLAALIGATVLPMAFGGGARATSLPSVLGAPLVGNGQFCSAAAGSSIVGDGASFANNAHQHVFIPAFAAACSKESVSYTAGGSGKGIASYINRDHYLTGSDDPLSADLWLCGNADLGATAATCNLAPGSARVDAGQVIPIALGAVTASYNLTNCGVGSNEAVKLRSPVLAKIYEGAINTWNDALIVADNANLKSCNQPIKLIVRSDVSGTTFAWKDYLSKRNPEFNVFKQPSFNTTWPLETLGTGHIYARGNGNGGVASLVKLTPGALGYVELSATKAAGNTWALIDGPHLQFISPDTGKQANCALAGAEAVLPPSTFLPGWDAVSIADSPNPLSYPACTFTYILLHTALPHAFGAYNKNAGRVLVDYLLTALSPQVQNALANAYYAPLPENVRQEALAGVAVVEDQD